MIVFGHVLTCSWYLVAKFEKGQVCVYMENKKFKENKEFEQQIEKKEQQIYPKHENDIIKQQNNVNALEYIISLLEYNKIYVPKLMNLQPY
ncbi:hypothetical protein IMG5_187600 [Ichthyophthirius multifiliis]|uniref:Uncharacterized protein n=1 Tax=Ichthyophthirius multifiliis TaxID=5932 RepID=G0R3U8_ICHMU|nr:hypothetical protein IMG5_187600 [Ichthyophthirius multifiliis]EGR27855.1 hypothetical protein IMG5_187600 [Ichthyophthirius multifiliis]|eukprot:XP_004027200.1 hypothetical protein IMG5_187600 [Ichthyophthirius multifiliis]